MERGGGWIRFIFLITVIFFLTGCSGDRGEEDTDIEIIYFKADPEKGTAPLKVTFSWKLKLPDNSKAICKIDPLGNDRYEFEDKCTEEGNYTYTYNSEGLYKAKFVVTLNSKSATKTVNIEVTTLPVNRPPSIEKLTVTPQEGFIPLKVTFEIRATDPDNDKLICTIDADGDGTVDISVGECTGDIRREYTYNEIGSYTAKIEVSDRKHTVSKYIEVNTYPRNWHKLIKVRSNTQLKFLETTPDEGIVIAGTDDIYLPEDRRRPMFFIAKFNKYGKLMWTSQFYADGLSKIDVVYLKDSFFITGRHLDHSRKKHAYFIAKIDKNGLMEWQRAFKIKTGSGYNFIELGAVTVTDDGYIYIIGKYGYDLILIKADQKGEPLWSKVYKSPYNSPHISPNFIVEYDNTSILIGGHMYSPPTNSYDIFVIKIDKGGNILWQKSYSTTKDNSAYGIKLRNDGSVIIRGYVNIIGTGNGLLILSIDRDGNVIWSKAYHKGYQHFRANSLIEIDGTGFLASGSYAYSYSGNPPVYFYRPYYMMIDYQGNPIWVREINVMGYIQLDKTYDNAFAFMIGPSGLGRAEDLENLSACISTNQSDINIYSIDIQANDLNFTTEDTVVYIEEARLIKAPSEIKIDDCR